MGHDGSNLCPGVRIVRDVEGQRVGAVGGIELLVHVDPVLGHGNRCTTVYNSEAILVGDVVPSAVDFPRRVTGIVRGKLEKIVKNIEKFQEIRSKNFNSKIITRISGVKVNKDQNIKEMNKFWGGLVDQVAFVNYVPWENVYNSKKLNINTSCSDLWRRMFVWWNGDVNPCDVDYKSKLKVGNIKNNYIDQLWNSKKYISLRDEHNKKQRKEILPCNRCNVI